MGKEIATQVQEAQRDRKSTRLNSSHITISYAVFCLKKKIESNLKDLWDNVKCTNLHITGIPEGEEREKGIENVFEEIMAENIPNLKKETDTQVQEVQRVPNKMNPNRSIPRDRKSVV